MPAINSCIDGVHHTARYVMGEDEWSVGTEDGQALGSGGFWQFRTFSVTILLNWDFLVIFAIQFIASSFCFSSHTFCNININGHPSAA
jgi:hypothetical protein